jgi:hypothetical protein
MSQKRLDRNLSVARDRECIQQSRCCSQADWSKQKHIEPPPSSSSGGRFVFIYIYYWRAGAREANAKSVVCANIMRMQMRWAVARRRHIMNSEAMVRWWRMMRIMSTCMCWCAMSSCAARLCALSSRPFTC